MKYEARTLTEEGPGLTHGGARTSRAPADGWTEYRDSQAAAFAALKGESLAVLNAPTGWGKTLTLSGLVADDLIRDPGRRAVIAVPQRIIARGFTRPRRLALPGGEAVRWGVDRDLCAPGPGKVDRLREFLLGGTGDRVVVTTHAALALAWDSVRGVDRRRVWRGLTAVIDEAHHLRAGDETCNRLGAMARHAIEDGGPTSRLILATAFFFRGDRAPILSERHLPRFARHHVPFEDHWRGLEHVRHYRYDFVAYKGTIWQELDALLARDQPPTIIYCPPDGHRLYLGKDKRETVDRVIGVAERYYPRGLAVLDLTATDGRAGKVEYLQRHGDRVGAVVAVGLLREGADWVQAARVIDLNPSGSDQDRNQRFGRLIRDHPGKRLVSYFSFFPALATAPPGEQRAELSRLYAHFHASLVLDNALAPVRVAREPGGGGRGGEGAGRRAFDLLGGLGRQLQQDVIRGSYEALLAVADRNQGDVSPDEAREAVVGVLGSLGVDGRDREPLARQVLILMRRRRDPALAAGDLVDAGFDRVWRADALDGLVLYSAGLGGPDTFASIRQALATALDSRWDGNYDALASSGTPPRGDDPLYHWAAHNKVLHARGELPPGRARALEAIPWWSWQDGFEGRWERRFREIAALPACPESGTPGYDWVRQQRRQHAGGSLPPPGVEACGSIPWWGWGTNRDGWAERLEELRRLPSMPRGRSREYDWVKAQRSRYHKGTLEPERRAACESIPWFTW